MNMSCSREISAGAEYYDVLLFITCNGSSWWLQQFFSTAAINIQVLTLSSVIICNHVSIYNYSGLSCYVLPIVSLCVKLFMRFLFLIAYITIYMRIWTMQHMARWIVWMSFSLLAMFVSRQMMCIVLVAYWNYNLIRASG